MDPVKVAGIAEWPVPQRAKDVQAFLGKLLPTVHQGLLEDRTSAVRLDKERRAMVMDNALPEGF